MGDMRLNSLSPADGSKRDRKRVGRGIGSGLGKTGGRGHKGLKSRSGGSVKVGFEGGQMPLQRRLPKVGFVSRKSLSHAEVRLGEVSAVDGDSVTIESLIKAGVIRRDVKTAKIMLSGKIERAVNVSGVRVSKGARAAIEAAGGSVSD